ncbi:MAG: glycosyltransferase family 2 protein [Candidatus Omnitrophota bacterium]|nr:glycosyltransferase family 2 protein [Candidatus Omnitrophota bacterium]
MNRIPVSVVIITKNEEKNIDVCLRSVAGWADEIIVVDDESTDRTVELAKRFGVKLFTRKMENEGRHRNWAYAQAKNTWVLSLDADEEVLPELREEITVLLSGQPKFPAYTIPRRNYIGNYWVKYGGQYPASQLRLFLKDQFRYEEVEVHPRVFLDGDTGHLPQGKDIVHKSYRDFSHFLAKLNGQTTLEATKWIKTGRQMSFGRALWRTSDRFFRLLLRKKAYKDGFIGFMFAVFAGLYQIMSYAKYWEMKKAKGLR